MGTVLRCSAEDRLKRCRRDLTLQLFLRSGPFWEAIHTFRTQWSIVPVTKIPTESDRIRYPPVCPEPTAPAAQADNAEPYDWTRAPKCWEEAVAVNLMRRTIPRACLIPEARLRSNQLWFPFLSACVRCDPPATEELLAFADTGEPEPETFFEATFTTDTADDPDAIGEVSMIAPPIAFSDPDHSDAVHLRHEEILIDELHRRLEPVGVNVKALVREVRSDPRYLEKFFSRPFEPDLSKVHIVVTAQSTEQDVRDSWRLIQSWFQTPPRRGRPKIDELEAVQAAILSEQGWTESQIADRFRWPRHPESNDTRVRSNATRYRLTKGRRLLHSRKYSAD